MKISVALIFDRENVLEPIARHRRFSAHSFRFVETGFISGAVT